MPRARDRYSSVGTPHKHTPIKVPLNDDKQEKAKRLQSRQALHETQMNQIRAAATPVRRRQTLSGQSQHSFVDNDENTFHVGGDAVTPMKRVPILANFEEWMKMATDNKINANNSWNFALIDYFHDMSLLKEGDSVNFQRASCTLDGCVKIYTSRIDSVATETGKLLSGLATSSDSKKRKGDDADGDAEDEDEEEGEDGQRKKTRKRAQRSAESTLVSSFAQLQLKKMDMELSVDPLFKKASADFDEGGAKGLLLNHLSIDATGRIVFDSSDDVEPGQPEAEAEEQAQEQEQDGDAMEVDGEEAKPEPETTHTDIDISALAAKFFPDLSVLDGQDICPSLKDFDLGDSNAANLPFLKAPDDWRNENQDDEKDDGAGGFLEGGFDDDDDMGAFDLPAETGFGEGGEVWAREAALETQMRVHTMGPGSDDRDGEEGMDEVGGFDADYGVTLTGGREHDQENILDYFDKALSKNWAGPEHWRIRRIKDINKASEAGPTKRKEKEPFQIDFSAPMTQSTADALYTPATTSSAILLPKAQWKSKSRNLLPDDKHFNSRQLLRLFLKPKTRLGVRTKFGGNKGRSENQRQQEPEGEMDEVFWARNEDPNVQNPENDDAPAQGDYDADFFQDDGLGAIGGPDDSDIFADAREMFSPPPEFKEGAQAGEASVLNGNQEGAFGTQLVTQSRRLRPEYVQYARVAKKVDVRRLKEEMWRGIGIEVPEENNEDSILSNKAPAPPAPKAEDGSLKFTDVVNNLQAVYPKKQLADISTSYCFICLLHLANEKGLVIENDENFTDLTIRKDPRAILDGSE
ncbi:Condensin complex component cnd2 [Lasiodiplodia theobromae]|uniref:Condensin complex component cnd2 n=1 Tax=Lasiodiplodia theobromae TaxID=45133 RepID=UPI0015C2CD75|nr:Condensin complex component cnd2 [Lasiodiplodia theobromae]KAF4534843.1 Condensin complex component cnd2 [Lasiodiplodia theobromae]